MNSQLLVAIIDGQKIGIPAIDVQSVIDLRTLTPVPHAPDRVAGMTALRSQLLTVINCRIAAGLNPAPVANGLGRAIVIIQDGHHYALMIDAVADVTDMQGPVQSVPSHLNAGWAAIARGMVDSAAGLLLVIDIHALIFGMQRSRAA
jgi:purine-binding chemotaxis protein CheW